MVFIVVRSLFGLALVLFFVVCLGFVSLQYYRAKYQVSNLAYYGYLDQLRFPFSLYRREAFRQLLEADEPDLVSIWIERAMFAGGAILFGIGGQAVGVFTGSASIVERLFYFVILAVEVGALVFAWRFGRDLKTA